MIKGNINYPIPVRKQHSQTQLLTEVRECTGECEMGVGLGNNCFQSQFQLTGGS